MNLLENGIVWLILKENCEYLKQLYLGVAMKNTDLKQLEVLFGNLNKIIARLELTYSHLNKMNTHHLYPRHALDWYGRNTAINKKLINDKTHTNHHRVFWNAEFHNQILQVLDFNAQILQERIIQEVSEIMCQDLHYIYKDWVYIPKY